MPKTRLYIQEVATRDGFQNEAVFIPTDEKIALINALSECGYARIEATSFTSPRAIPALRDAEEVMHRIARKDGVEYTVLVPNVRGAERALSCGVDEVNLVMSVSETHNRANLRMTREASFEQLSNVVDVIKDSSIAINVSLSTVFGCPMEGDIEFKNVLAWVEQFESLGVRGITLCDTTGMAYPSQVEALLGQIRKTFPSLMLTAHFHNTRGLGLANVLAALNAGIDRFDASLGGLGGCPYAPGATGNICTEDLVHMLELMGYDTGVSLERCLAASREIARLVGRDTPSAILKAGPRLSLHPAPDHVHDLAQPQLS